MGCTDGGNNPLPEDRVGLLRRREEILRDNYPVLLDTLSLADELSAQLSVVRRNVRGLTEGVLPRLEEITGYEWVERNISKPHRDRAEQARKHLKVEQERRHQLFLDRSINLLQSDIPLTSCLRLVSAMKQQKEFITEPTKLMGIFLDARTRYLTTVIEGSIVGRSVEGNGDSRLFEDIVRVMREPVVDVVTQYQAIFTDPYPLCRFLIARLDWFITSITTLIKSARNTLVLASYWNQLVLLNASFASIGASFIPLVRPLFLQQATQLLSASAATSWQYFQSKASDKSLLTLPLLRKPNSHRATQSSTSAGKDIRPPGGLSEFPWLVLALNCILDILEQIRVFAIPEMHQPVNNLIDKQLTLYLNYVEGKSKGQPPSDVLALQTCQNEVLRPFINLVLDGYFPGVNCEC